MPAFVHKKSSSASAVPSTSQLSLGEIAINTYDGKLFTLKDVSGTQSIVEIGSTGTDTLWTGTASTLVAATGRTSLGLGTGAVLDTAAIADSGTGLATADQIHTFVTGFAYATLASPTFTGTVAIPNVANLETAVVANTAKTGITGAQASAITANTSKNTNVSTALSTGTVNSTSYGITSDGGSDDIVLAQADTDDAGLLSAAKWDEIVANTSKTTNATHTSDVTGATALTIKDDVALAGNPTTTTQTASNSTTRIATTAFVQAAVDADINALVDSAPGTLNTLNELAAALGDDASYASTITTALALKSTIASPTFTGTVAIPNVANLETAVVANTAKTGITGAQASAITANTAKNTNVSTALSQGTTSTTVYNITSDSGANDIAIPTATTSQAGVMSGALWDKLDGGTTESMGSRAQDYRTQVLSNKTLIAPILNTPVINTGIQGNAIIDSDTLSGATSSNVASSECIKAYVDSQTGDVTKVGTPVDNYVGVWTGNGTIEGTASLRFNSSALDVRGDVNVGVLERMKISDNTISITAGTFTLATTGVPGGVPAAAPIIIDSSDDITLDAEGGQITMKDASVGTDALIFNLDATPELDVTGDFKIDGTGDITIDADGGELILIADSEIQFKENTREIAAMASISADIHIMSFGGTAPSTAAGVGFRYNDGEMQYRNSDHDSSSWTSLDALGVSDQNVKNSISNFNTGLSLINQLQPKNYKYNEDYRIAYHLEEENRVGMIAQDLQSISDNYVKLSSTRLGRVEIEPGIDDSEKYFKPSELYEQELQGALINAIKELSTKNDALEARLAILEAA